MKKRLLTAALVALLPLSLAACGGQSKQDACQIINDKAVKAIDGLEDMIQGMTKVAAVLKSDDITNADVKAAAVAAGDSAQALADFAKTAGDDPSTDQMTEAMDLYTTFATSMSSLETLCNAK
jgi:Flp pilus assembly protein TadD